MERQKHSQPKVAILHWQAIPLDLNRVGGVLRVELSQLEKLKERNFKVKIYAMNVKGRHSDIRSIPNYNFLGKHSMRAFYVDFAIRTCRFDILHGANMPILGRIAPRRSLIFYSNNVDSVPLCSYEKAKEKYHRTHFAFCSNYTKNDFLTKYSDVPQDNCWVVHEAVDIKKFVPSPNQGSNLQTGKKRVFFLGQWSKEKGIFVLLEAAKILSQIRPRSDYEIILGGSPYYWKVDRDVARNTEIIVGEAANELKELSIMGEVVYDEYPDILQSMDIFVNPAVWAEPFPLVNLEAMASGLPVIASRVGGIQEAIDNGKNGLLCESNNPRELAEAIEYLLDDDSLRHALGKEARKTVEEKFSWDRHIEKLIEIYNHILEHK